MPKNLLSRFIGSIASCTCSRFAILGFAKKYKINLDEAEKNIEDYPTLNKFFTRHLKKDLRPIDSPDDNTVIVSSVDCKVNEFGNIEDDKMIQAKGIDYTVKDLLGDSEEAAWFKNGQYIVLYLSPTDYHRIHSHCNGEVFKYRYIPGKLFPVNVFSVSHIANLYGINERMTAYMNCEGRKSALVKVGATVVGKIKAEYTETVSNVSNKIVYEEFSEPKKFTKGQEIGLFEMGSTVILLFEKDSFEFDSKIQKDLKLKLGEKLGILKK